MAVSLVSLVPIVAVFSIPLLPSRASGSEPDG
jgi:hypothetical protein